MVVLVWVSSLMVLFSEVLLYRLCMNGVCLMMVLVMLWFLFELSVMICVYGNEWCSICVSFVKCLVG